MTYTMTTTPTSTSLVKALGAVGALLLAPAGATLLTMRKVGGYTSLAGNPLEIVVVKPSTNHVFVASEAGGVAILQIDDDLSPAMVGVYNTTTTFGAATSVAYNPVYDELAISVKAFDTLTKGQVYIVSSVEDWIECGLCEDYVQILTAGFGPDMITFTPDGRRILTANEGEPVDYTKAENDPVGTVSIFKRKWSTRMYQEPCEVNFDKFDKPYRTRTLVARGMRVGGADFTTFSMDMEPEYIAVTENSNTAYVTLQENNAVVKIDIKGCEVNRMFPLGYKEWGNGVKFDASDRDDAINLRNWPQVMGMYMPDSITTFKTGGTRYFLTANEGDAREYGDEDDSTFFTDEVRVEDLAEELGLDITMSPYDETNLGRLKVTNMAPYDGDINELYAFGGRSISIFNGKTGELVWDSGDFIATFIADPENGFSDIFNSQGDVESFDGRSDDKGAEPEGLVIAEIDGRIYVFVGLERTGGWMCWDVTDAEAPVFQSYTNSNDIDTAPEGGAIISAEDSPSGKALLIGAYEASNTLAVFEITVD